MIYDDRPDPAQRLEQARIARGFRTAKDAARFFGWSYETYAQHENGTRGIPRAAAKYAKAFNVSEGWLLTGEGVGPNKKHNQDEQDARKNEGLQTTNIPLGFIRVTGRVAAGTWMDTEEMDFDYSDVHMVPSVGGYLQSNQFALIVTGKSLNRIANDGDILVCVNVIAERIDIMPDDLVVVERRKHAGQMVERTAKRVRETSNGFELWPESTDPAHQEPIRLYGVHDGEQIDVIGKVLWILRKP